MERTVEVDGERSCRSSLISRPADRRQRGPRVRPEPRIVERLLGALQLVSPCLHDHRSGRAAKLVGEVTGGYQVPPGF
jgi:hypothetical protein